MSKQDIQNAVLRRMAKEANVSITTMRLWLGHNKELQAFHEMAVNKCMEELV